MMYTAYGFRRSLGRLHSRSDKSRRAVRQIPSQRSSSNRRTPVSCVAGSPRYGCTVSGSIRNFHRDYNVSVKICIEFMYCFRKNLSSIIYKHNYYFNSIADDVNRIECVSKVYGRRCVETILSVFSRKALVQKVVFFF